MPSPSVHESTFYILTALASEALHGYGLIQRVETLSEGRVKLRASTLYDALDRLVREGLIEVDHDELVGRRLRRFYRLSATGRELLSAEAARLLRNAELAIGRLRGAPLRPQPAATPPTPA